MSQWIFFLKIFWGIADDTINCAEVIDKLELLIINENNSIRILCKMMLFIIKAYEEDYENDKVIAIGKEVIKDMSFMKTSSIRFIDEMPPIWGIFYRFISAYIKDNFREMPNLRIDITSNDNLFKVVFLKVLLKSNKLKDYKYEVRESVSSVVINFKLLLLSKYIVMPTGSLNHLQKVKK